MTKVLVSDPIDQAGIDILSQVATVDVRTGLPADELKAIIGDYDALMIRSGTTVTAVAPCGAVPPARPASAVGPPGVVPGAGPESAPGTAPRSKSRSACCCW